MRYLSALMLSLGLAAAPGCKTDSEAGDLEVLYALAPDDTCKFTPDNAQPLQGFYDPVANDSGYRLVVALRNNLPLAADEPLLLDGTTNVRSQVNNLTLVGFEGCWSQVQGDRTQFGKGGLLDCAALSGQSGTLTASGTVDAGGTELGLGHVEVLTPSHLRQLFGDTFSPLQIPRQGLLNATLPGGVVQKVYSPSLSDPADPKRDATWGTRYPPSIEAPVVVQLRAIAQAQSGKKVLSGWFTFPITICPGCLSDQCGPLVEKPCNQPCPDGTPCSVDGTCTSGGVVSACPTLPVYSGSNPVFSGCLPAQGFSKADCTASKVGC